MPPGERSSVRGPRNFLGWACRHNRQIYKSNILKGGLRKLNQAPYLVNGFRLFDKVRYNNVECFVFGRRSTGYFDIRETDGRKVHPAISFKKLTFLQASGTMLTKRNRQFLPETEDFGVSLPQFI